MKIILFLLFICSNAFAQDWSSRGSIFNPDIGVNTLFLYDHSNQDKTNNGFSFQEMELQFVADVDPYFRAQLILALEQEDGAYIIEPEEAYAETLRLKNTTLKFGKYYFNFGKHNLLHTHNFPLINAPLVNEGLLGEEGINLPALGMSYLLPLNWYSEILADYGQGTNETIFEDNSTKNKFFNLHLKNLWDLNEDTTMELGLTGASASEDVKLWQGDFTLKWRPMVGGKYHAFEWQTELMGKEKSDDFGFYSHLRYQLWQRWWLSYRYDQFEPMEDLIQRRNGLMVVFAPTEFSAFRVQGDYNSTNLETRVLAQFNITIGAHPAHRY